MTRRIALSITMGLFVAAIIAVAIWVNAKRSRILVLHSYELSYVWVQDINSGLARVFGKHSWVDVRYHYMETKKKETADHHRRAGIAARKAIEDLRPDVVIAFDDNAQDLAVKAFVDHPKIKIVFAGINGSIEPYGYHKAKNATGILERKPAAAVREVLTIMARDPANRIGSGDGRARALFLGDKSESVQHDADHLASFSWAPIEYLGVTTVDTFDEWKKAVLSLRDRTDFLLVGGYRRLRLAGAAKGRTFASPKEVMRWTEANSPVPVIGMNVFNTQDGAMMSVGVSPFEQAEVAADMALRIIEKGTAPHAIPVRQPRLYVIAVRESALKKRHIQVPSVFEAFARATDNYIEDASMPAMAAR